MLLFAVSLAANKKRIFREFFMIKVTYYNDWTTQEYGLGCSSFKARIAVLLSSREYAAFIASKGEGAWGE